MGLTALAIPDADVAYDAHFTPLGPDALGDVPWAQPMLTMFGREVEVPRLTCWMGDPGATYTYSGLRNEPVPWSPPVQALRERVEATVGVRFQGVLLNLYRDGRDAMGWHTDDEPELGPLLASVSLGATRTFRMKHPVHPPVAIELVGGSLLVMRPPTQERWKHAVPRRLRVHEPRLNLTFRQVR